MTTANATPKSHSDVERARIVESSTESLFRISNNVSTSVNTNLSISIMEFGIALQRHESDPVMAKRSLHKAITDFRSYVDSFDPKNEVKDTCIDISNDLAHASKALRNANGAIAEPFKKSFSSLAEALNLTSTYVNTYYLAMSLEPGSRPGIFYEVSKTTKDKIISKLEEILSFSEPSAQQPTKEVLRTSDSA